MHNPAALPQRKQIRLRGYDYAFPGAYFVTICSAGKRPVFGSVGGEGIVLSPAGEIVRSEWIALAERFSRLVLDEFVIMPNHLHGVLGFVGQAGGASRAPTAGNKTGEPVGAGGGPTGGASPSPTMRNTTTKPGEANPASTTRPRFREEARAGPMGNAPTKPGGASPSPTLFEVIGAFKSISTIKVNRLLRRSGVPLWQRSYYEHIVRTGEDLRKIQRYILENPLMWSLDPENPNREPT